MAKPTQIQTPTPRNTSGDDPATDYAVWQKLRPYIGHCLTLNHEINNALTGLLGYIDLMLLTRDDLSPDQIEYLESIQSAAQKIKSATEQLSREKIELSEEIDLRPVIEAYNRIAGDQSK
jgi:hypothetical protein